MKRHLVGLAAAALIAPGACGKQSAPASRPPVEELESALAPAHAGAAFRKLGGAHLAATTLFRISAPAAAAPQKTGEDAAPDSVTTTTDLSMDAAGNYRLVETNDQDGGREVILHGRELAMGLRHSKLVRRPAQEPEPTRYLEEALGGPWAAWETVRRFAEVERTAPGVFKVKKSAAPAAVAAEFGEPTPLKRWRETVVVQTLAGEVRVDAKTGALLAADLSAKFTAKRGDLPLHGELRVSARTDAVGKTPAIAAPAADELVPRQRTILEERALLENLGRPRPEKGTR